MNKTKKWVFAVCAGLAVLGTSGCANLRTADAARVDAMPASDLHVMRPMQSYGTLGGYRYRRFASVAATS